ncbi:MAG TPA: hydrolase TatD [Erysipelotrichaceae bacterium]|nr:hydrolase TatD [Erysipelotrichaceae bacterium]
MVGWIDSHAHLTSEDYDPDRSEMIRRAKDAGLQKILLIGCGVENSMQAIALAESDDLFDVAVGFHPQEIEEMNDETWEEMLKLWRHPKIVAIGEIGLDHYWHEAPEHRALQRVAFLKQIDIANQLDLPILIHTRDATQETFDILKDHPCHRAGIMHCYSGSVEMAREFIKLGYVISLAGPVTFKNAVVPKEVAKQIPLESLLIETDSPYLTPMPFRGKRNESAYVIHVSEEICRLKEIDVATLQDAMSVTYQRLFHSKNG